MHHAQLQILPINHVCYRCWLRVTNQNTKYTLIYSVFLVDHLRFGFVVLLRPLCLSSPAPSSLTVCRRCCCCCITKSKCKTTKFLELQVDYFLLEWIIDMNVNGKAEKPITTMKIELDCALLCYAHTNSSHIHRWRENNCDKTNDESKKSPMTITILCLRNRLSTSQTEWFRFYFWSTSLSVTDIYHSRFDLSLFHQKNDGELLFQLHLGSDELRVTMNEITTNDCQLKKEHILCICNSVLIYHRSTVIHSKYKIFETCRTYATLNLHIKIKAYKISQIRWKC